MTAAILSVRSGLPHETVRCPWPERCRETETAAGTVDGRSQKQGVNLPMMIAYAPVMGAALRQVSAETDRTVRLVPRPAEP